MTATITTAPETTDTETSVTTNSLWKTGAVAGVAAAAATTVVAAVARGLDVSLAIDGEAIPIAGFAQLTLFFTAVGVVLARVMARRASQPRSTFVTTTIALTVLSFVPDALLSADTASKLTLVVTHLVAAAIVIPALSARLPEQSTR
jgi:hypothetical protein